MKFEDEQLAHMILYMSAAVPTSQRVSVEAAVQSPFCYIIGTVFY